MKHREASLTYSCAFLAVRSRKSWETDGTLCATTEQEVICSFNDKTSPSTQHNAEKDFIGDLDTDQ